MTRNNKFGHFSKSELLQNMTNSTGHDHDLISSEGYLCTCQILGYSLSSTENAQNPQVWSIFIFLACVTLRYDR